MACGVGASLAALPHRRYRGPQTRSPARTDPREEGRLAHREGVSFRATPFCLRACAKEDLHAVEVELFPLGGGLGEPRLRRGSEAVENRLGGGDIALVPHR